MPGSTDVHFRRALDETVFNTPFFSATSFLGLQGTRALKLGQVDAVSSATYGGAR